MVSAGLNTVLHVLCVIQSDLFVTFVTVGLVCVLETY